MEILNKLMDTESAFSTQAIYLVLLESSWNPNTEKIYSIQEIFSLRETRLVHSAANFLKQTRLCSRARISKYTIAHGRN